MEPYYLDVARNCQGLARKLAAYQNLAGDLSPRNRVIRWFRWLVGVDHPRLSGNDVTDLVSALLSAGNMLECVAKEKQAVSQLSVPQVIQG